MGVDEGNLQVRRHTGKCPITIYCYTSFVSVQQYNTVQYHSNNSI